MQKKKEKLFKGLMPATIALFLASILMAYSLFAPLALAAASEQWAAPLDLGSNGDLPKVVRTSGGNYIAIWRNDNRGIQTVQALKFDIDGDLLWGSYITISEMGGVLPMREEDHLRLVPDNNDGAFFAYSYRSAGWDVVDTYVGRIGEDTGEGERTCIENLYGASGDIPENAIDILSDGANGVYAAWISADVDDYTVHMTHLDGSCAVDTNWNTGAVDPFRAVVVANNDTETYHDVKLTASSEGDVIVEYVMSTNTYYYLHDGFDGAQLDGPAVIASSEASSVTDGSGGLLVGYLTGAEETKDAYAHRIEKDMDFAWAGPVQIDNDGFGSTHIQAAADGSGGAYFAWAETEETWSNTMLYAQGVDSSGNLWRPAKLLLTSDEELASLPQYQRDMISNGDGGFYLGYQGVDASAGVIQVLDDGTLEYDLGGYIFSATASANYPGLAWDGTDGVIVTYVDAGTKAQHLQTDSGGGGGCGDLGEGEVCGTMNLDCPAASRNFLDTPNDFVLGLTGQRFILSVNDISYDSELNGAYFNETDPGEYDDETDTLLISSNTPYSCGDEDSSLTLTVEATPFLEETTSEPMISYGPDAEEDDPPFSNDDYAGMFSVITSLEAVCVDPDCVLANNSVEESNEIKHGENNYFLNPDPGDSTKNDTGFDDTALLIDTDNSTNTVTLYSASHGLEGEVPIPGLDFSLILPANLAQGGSYSSEVTYTLF